MPHWRLVSVPTTASPRRTSSTEGRFALLAVFGIFGRSAHQGYADRTGCLAITLTAGMSKKRLNSWHQMLGNQYGFHSQYAGHFQQSRDPEIAASLDSGNRDLWLRDEGTSRHC